MAEELLAAAAIAALALSDDEAEESTGLVATEWSDGSVLGSYSVDGGTVDIISQTAQPGSVDEGLLRLAADAPAGRRYPDENRPGLLMNQPSGRKYRPSEIQKVADQWIDSIPEQGPNNPPGPDPGPLPERPPLPGGPMNPGGGLSDPGSFSPLVMTSNQPDLVTGLSGFPPLVNDGRGSVTGGSFQQATKPPEDDPVDTDGDGVQSPEEIQAYIDKLREEEFERQRQENDGFHPADTNQDGTIDAREYITYYGVPEEELDEDGTGIIADDMTADPEDPENQGLVGNGGGGLRVTPNLSSNFKTQIEALQAGEESCFKLAQGQGWTYLAGGKVLQLEEGGALDRKTTPGVLALQINDGYTLRMICGVEGGFLGIQGAATSEIFDNDVIKEGNPGIGAVADAIIENEYADFIMMPGDSIQVDIDGISGVGDFRVTSKGREITDSYAVRNDVQFAIVPNSVLYREGSPGFTEDDIERRPKPDPLPDDDDNGNGNGNGSSDRMSPLSVVLVLAGLGAFIYFLVTRRKGGGE